MQTSGRGMRSSSQEGEAVEKQRSSEEEPVVMQ